MLRATQSDAGGQGDCARQDDSDRKGSAQLPGAALLAEAAKGGGNRSFLCAYGECLHKAQAAERRAVPTSVT